MPAPNEITPKQLMRLIGLPDQPVIVDICLDEDFAQDPYLIPGSIRHPHSDMDGLVARIGALSCVVVCQKGLKLSQGLASRLRGRGIAAEFLQGGMVGWRETRDAPRTKFSTLPLTNLWVTRHRPKIDRVACPWLIRRFVDPQAEFVFVSPDQVLSVAERFDATAFDVQGTHFTHHGANCTFDAMLDTFDLHTPALDNMATIVRAADTGTTTSPQAAGLLAISLGLSRMYRNDHAQLDAAFPLYDALYRWARDAADETHTSFSGAS